MWHIKKILRNTKKIPNHLQKNLPILGGFFVLYINYRFFPTFRLETMSTFEYFFARRDFCPFPVGFP